VTTETQLDTLEAKGLIRLAALRPELEAVDGFIGLDEPGREDGRLDAVRARSQRDRRRQQKASE